MERKEEEVSLGQWLQQQRLQHDLDLDVISTRTNVPIRFLEAIEQDRFEDLPGPPYAAGFVGKFARELELDEQLALQRYKAEAKPCRVEPRFQITEPPVESRLPTRSMVMSGLIVAVLTYSVWFSLNNSNTEALAAIAVPDRLLAETAAHESRTLAASDKKEAMQVKDNMANNRDAGKNALASAERYEVAENDAVVVENPDLDDESEATLDETKSAPEAYEPENTDQLAVNNVDDELPVSSVVEEASSPASFSNGVAANGEVADNDVAVEQTPAMVIEVVDDAWVHVTRGDEILYTGVMKAGRRYQPVSGAGVELTTGNAAGIVLHHGNWSSGPLGRQGRVKRAVSLDPKDWDERFRENGHG